MIWIRPNGVLIESNNGMLRIKVFMIFGLQRLSSFVHKPKLASSRTTIRSFAVKSLTNLIIGWKVLAMPAMLLIMTLELYNHLILLTGLGQLFGMLMPNK